MADLAVNSPERFIPDEFRQAAEDLRDRVLSDYQSIEKPNYIARDRGGAAPRPSVPAGEGGRLARDRASEIAAINKANADYWAGANS
jgi:hypothetical protein